MKKLVVLLCALLALGSSAQALEVSAPSALLMEKETGTVLFAKDEHAKLEPASVTKVMTLLLTMEAIDAGQLHYDDVVTASAHACSMGGSQIWLKENEQMTVSDMLKAVCVVSANDCAVALAEAVSGSVDAFVEAYPSFLTILERDTRPIKGRFLKTAVSRALPYGLAAAGMIAFVSLAAPFGEAGKQTVMYLSLILISMTAVIKSCLPFTPLRAFACVTMAAGCFGALGILPDLFQVTALSSQMAVWLAAVTAAAWVFLLIADGIRKIAQDSGKRAQTDV